MRWMVFMLLLAVAGYQLFFRYDYWSSQERDGIVYERDNLTGQVQAIAPGEKRDWVERLLPWEQQPSGKAELAKPGQSVEPHQEPKRLKPANPQRDDRELGTVVSTAPPVPHHPDAPAALSFSIRQVDLNLDGQPEEIIQDLAKVGDSLDISIVKDGREIFFGQGNELSILNTRNTGWADIAVQSGKELRTYRYSAQQGLYQSIP